MDLVTLENWLDNTVFGILLATMLLYWLGAAFREQGPWLTGLGRTGMILANLGLVGLLAARWLEGARRWSDHSGSRSSLRRERRPTTHALPNRCRAGSSR